MSQITILKKIVRTEGIFSTPWQRHVAHDNLMKKLRRRDKQLMKKTQTKLFDVRD